MAFRWTVPVVLILCFSGCSSAAANTDIIVKEVTSTTGLYEEMEDKMFDGNTTVTEVINASEFEGFGQFIFPNGYSSYEGMTLDDSNFLLPYHSHIDTDTTVEVVNTLLEMLKD